MCRSFQDQRARKRAADARYRWTAEKGFLDRPCRISDLAEKLSIAERLQLVEDIWDSIADETEALPLTDAQKAELDRRLEQYRRDPDSAIHWEQVREELSKPGG